MPPLLAAYRDNTSDEIPSGVPLTRTVQYIRMSTDHQKYSIQNQSAAIALYAAAHGMSIVRSYVDAGKSGLSITRRKALRELLQVVESRQADFALILVYDVSRWGRFLDADESAHYEYLCKRAGIHVRYCAEQFENDNSTTSNLLKALKRTMAGEFSRELSVKIFAGQSRLFQIGYRMGGPPGFGLRRQLVDEKNQPKQMLSRGQEKSIHTDRTKVILGPPQDLATVRRMYDLFTKRRMGETVSNRLCGTWPRFSSVITAKRPMSITSKPPVEGRREEPQSTLSTVRKAKDSKHEEHARASELYQFYLDIAPEALQLYDKWKSHQGFAGTGIRAITRDKREIVEVPDGIIFPILASLSAFAKETPGGWRIKPPKLFKDEELIRAAKSVYQNVAASNPWLMGKSKARYFALNQITSIYQRLSE